jgi:hypothetical protein
VKRTLNEIQLAHHTLCLCSLRVNASFVGTKRILSTKRKTHWRYCEIVELLLRFSAQRRPLVIHSFSLDLPDPAFAHVELLDDENAGLRHAHLVILGVYQGQENLPAPSFRKLFVFYFLDHDSASSGKDIPYCEGMIPRSAGLQQAQLGPVRVFIAPPVIGRQEC